MACLEHKMMLCDILDQWSFAEAKGCCGCLPLLCSSLEANTPGGTWVVCGRSFKLSFSIAGAWKYRHYDSYLHLVITQCFNHQRLCLYIIDSIIVNHIIPTRTLVQGPWVSVSTLRGRKCEINCTHTSSSNNLF